MALPDPIQQFIDATNRGDSEAFVDAFTDDATLDDWGRVFSGRDGIRSWDSTDNTGVNTKFDLISWKVRSEDTFVVVLKVTGDGYNGTGPMEFTLNADGISRLIISDSVG